jgi:pimeloyl-ACP methyl ester carboxylesterase
MDYTFKKKYIRLINGEKIAYIDKGRSDKIILLIHGNMASSATMITLIDALKDDYRVIAPDMRGFGDSSFNQNFTTLKALAFDIFLFCNSLNIEKAHVIGWSTGFGVAMELALLAPQVVQSLFSIEGMSVKGYYSIRKDKNGDILKHKVFESYKEMKIDPNMTFVPDALERQDRVFVENIWTNLLLHVKPKKNKKLLNLYIDETLKERCQMNINWCWVNFNISEEANLYTKGHDRISELNCPVYLTLSDQDNVVTKDMILENIRLIKHAKVIEFKEAGHCLHMDQLEALVDVIKQYLQ